MVSALRFKGDKKPKKRKRANIDDAEAGEDEASSSKAPKNVHLADDDDEGWIDSDIIEDLNGPILLALSATDSPICLASDAAGQVFASPLTASSIAEAEPTDVQQVWVCTKIYGSIEDKFSLRSHQGKYLSVDKHGLLSATREAISPEEEFLLVRCEPSGGRWALQTVREKFIAVEERKSGTAAVRGDSETVGFGETWLVRVQKRNKIQGGGARRGGDDRGRVKDRITKKELEEMAGVKLDDGQIKMLKKARKEGRFHEALLDVRVKHGKHDKFAY